MSTPEFVRLITALPSSTGTNLNSIQQTAIFWPLSEF